MTQKQYATSQDDGTVIPDWASEMAFMTQCEICDTKFRKEFDGKTMCQDCQKHHDNYVIKMHDLDVKEGLIKCNNPNHTH